MKRLTVLAVLVVTLATLLAACGSDDTPTMASGDSPAMTHGDSTGGGTAGGMKGDHGKSSGVADGARRIEVTAKSFSFAPGEIRAKVGEQIAVALTSSDLLHDFTIDELDAHVAAGPGKTEEGGFKATKPGRYTYYCSVAGHRQAGMQGTLVIE